MDEDYETEQLLSDVGDGEEDARTASETSLQEVVEREEEEGEDRLAFSSSASGCGRLDSARAAAGRGAKLLGFCRALKGSWLMMECLKLFRLALPVVRETPSLPPLSPLHHLLLLCVCVCVCVQFVMNVLQQSVFFIILLFLGKFGGNQQLNAAGMECVLILWQSAVYYFYSLTPMPLLWTSKQR